MRGRLLASGLAGLVLATALSGCGTGPGSPTETQTSNPVEPSSSALSPTPSLIAPTESVSPSSAPTESQNVTPTTPTGNVTLRERLLVGVEVPGFNATFGWRNGVTRSAEGRTTFGTCQKFAMTSIGATRVVTRDYLPRDGSPGATASNLVAQFADALTARHAYEVLKSWREQCDPMLKGYANRDVGELQSVSAQERGGDAVGDWYLLSYGPVQGAPDDGYFDAQGITRKGSRISMVQMRAAEQDYNYPTGKEPMVAAVRAAAVKLG